MKSKVHKFGRKSFRLPNYDYSQNGAYFVTVIAYKRQLLFGKIIDDVVKLNEIGEIVLKTWHEIPMQFPYVNSRIFVVMPNHVHGIILIEPVGATHTSPLRKIEIPSPENLQIKTSPTGPKPRSLGAIIGSFKAAASKRIHSMHDYKTCKVWQRNYYEHIIRDEESLQRIADYILSNPANWDVDPINVTK